MRTLNILGYFIVIICCLTVLIISSDCIAMGPFFHIAIDKDNSLWIASADGAIHIAKDGSVKIYNKSSGLPDKVFQILIAADGSKWFAGGSVYTTESMPNRVSMTMCAMGASHLKNDGSIQVFNSKNGLPSSMVYCVATDLNGNVWFGTNTGLAHMDSNSQIEEITGLPGIPPNIRHIFIDKDGMIWLAIWEGGVVCIDKQGNIVKTYNKSSGLASDVVTNISIDANGTMWFAHGGVYGTSQTQSWNYDGVSHIKQDGSIEIFNYKDGLPSGMVYCTAADINNTMWFASNKGAAHLDNKGQFTIFNKNNGLPDDNIRHILVDKEGNKWFATDTGVSRMGKDGKIILVYPKQQ